MARILAGKADNRGQEARGRPRKVKIVKSNIKNAGLGLFVPEDVRKAEWIARYSGTPLIKKENAEHGYSHYRLKVHVKLFLDSSDSRNFEGHYINDIIFQICAPSSRPTIGDIAGYEYM